ncbi:hypothetical protein PHLCEN_2v12353, partial [Hermanssonia centrifuga]
VVSLFSLIVLALSANWISVTTTKLHLYYNYAALGVATSVLTFTLPVMLIIDLLRRGAFTSMILVELCWLGFLWVMWLATGALAADNLGGFVDGCSSSFFANWWNTGCSETQAITAFSFLNWIALTGYLALLLTMSILAANRGGPVWMTSVKEANFAPVNVNMSGAMGTPEHKGQLGTPMQQPSLQSYPPQQPGYSSPA